MTTDSTAQSMDALSDLLEAERATLLTGKLVDLAQMVDEKERLIEAVSMADDAQPEALALLDQKAKRNQLLLDGALDGIRTVARRLAALRQVKVSLDTYDANGTRNAIEVTAAPKVERRA